MTEQVEKSSALSGLEETPSFGGQTPSTDFSTYTNLEIPQGTDPTPDYDPDFSDVIGPIADELAGYELGPPDPVGMQMSQYHIEYWYRAYANRLQDYEDALYTSPQQELNKWGVPAAWDYRNPQKVGPWGEYLPQGAIGWTPKGQADYGGGIAGQIKRIWYNAIRDWGDPGGEAEGTAIQSFHVDEISAPRLDLASELWDAGSYGKSLGEVAGAGFEWTMRTIREGWSSLEGVGKYPNVFGMLARSIGFNVNLLGVAVDEISKVPEKIIGPTVLADAEYLERQWERNGEDVPALFEQARKWNLFGWPLPLIMNIGNRHEKEYGEILEEVRSAGEMAYSGWMHPASMEEFKRRVASNEDPRHVTMDLESIGAEAVGRMILDPINLIEFLPKMARIFSKTKDVVVALDVADDVNDAYKAINAADSYATVARDASNATDIIQSTFIAHSEGRIAQALKRGVTVPTAIYKQTELAHNTSAFFMSALAHSGRDMDKFNDIMVGISLIGDTENAENVWRGVNILNKVNFPVGVTFSEQGLDASRLMRHFLLGKDDALDASRVVEAISEAGGNPEKLAGLFDEMYDDAVRQLNPSMTDQIKQNDRYLELLESDADEAAKFLSNNPLAAEEIPEFTRKLDAGHQFLQQRFFGKVATLQGHLFFTANPAFPFYNRWGNFLPSLIDSGPKAAFKGLFGWGYPDKAWAQLDRMLGFVPEAAGRGISAAGAIGNKPRGFGALAQIDETRNAGFIMASEVDKGLRTGLREGLAIPTVPQSLQGIKQQLVRLAQDTYGKVDEIKKAIRGKTIPSGRDLLNISDDVVKDVKDLGHWDDYVEISRRSENYDDAERVIREYIDERRKLGLLASKDPPQIRISDLPIEIQEGVAKEANLLADLVDSGKLTTAEADIFLHQLTMDRVVFNEAQTLTNNLWADVHGYRTNVIYEQYKSANKLDELGDANAALSAQMKAESASYGEKISEINVAAVSEHDELRRLTKRYGGLGEEVGVIRRLRKDESGFQAARTMWHDRLRMPEAVVYKGKSLTLDEILKMRDWKFQLERRVWEHYFAKRAAVWGGAREAGVRVLSIEAERYATELGIDLASRANKYGEQLFRVNQIAENSRAMDVAFRAADGTLVYKQGVPNLFDNAIEAYEKANPDGKGSEFIRALREALEEGVEEVPEAARVAIEDEIRVLEKELATYDIRIGMGSPESEEIAAKIKQEIDSLRARIPEAGRVAETADFKMGFIDPDGQTVLRELAEEGESRVDTASRILAAENTPPNIETRPIVPEYLDGPPSDARYFYESQGPASEITDRFLDELKRTWDDQTILALDTQMEGDLADWLNDLNGRSTELKHMVVERASETRDFILHNYGKKIGADVMASYVWPYQFWHSRTYGKWMKRALQHPSIVSKYFIYRNSLERMHPNAPEWYKHQVNTNELFGLDSESPLWFSLEGSLNPLKGLTGVDFNDPRRRQDWIGGVIDDLNKFGPSVWMPYQVAMAAKYHLQGQTDAAERWAGRLWTPSRYIRDMTALIDPKGKGLELDPFMLTGFGGDPYEITRVGRMLSHMQGEGTYTGAELMDAAYQQTGPIWEEAYARTINMRAPNALAVVAPFMLGTGFKMRNETDIEIDRFYNEMYNLVDMRDNLSAEEYRDRWSQLEQRYPYMDALLLVKKSGPDRDEALAWNVLDRIPPGQSRQFSELAGIPDGALDSFYDNKGDLEFMNEADRLQFMGGVINLSALLDLPDHATRTEWDMVSAVYRDMRTLGEQLFGEDIWLHEDTYYANYDSENPSAADSVFEMYPVLQTAMDWKDDMLTNTPFLAAYYSSINKIERFYKREMYSEAERRYGDDLWDHFEVWSRLKAQNSKAASAYWKDHPKMEDYTDFKAETLPTIAAKLDFLGTVIPETRPPIYRSGGEGPSPEAMESEDPNEAWISGQVLEYMSGLEPEEEEEAPLTFDEQQLQELMGEPLFRLWQMGGALPEIARRRLQGLGLNADGTLIQTVAPTPEPSRYGDQGISDDEFGDIPEDPITLFGQELIDRGLNEVKENQGGLTKELLGLVVDAAGAKGYYEDEAVAWFIEAVGARDPYDVPPPRTEGGFIPENIRLGGMSGPEAMVGQQVENIFSETTVLHAAVGYNKFTKGFHRLIDKIGAIATREGESPGYVWEHSSPHIKSYSGEGPMNRQQRDTIVHEFAHKAGDESNIDWDDFKKSVNRVLAQEQDPHTRYYTTVRRISEFPGIRLDTRGQDYEWGGPGELYASMFEWTDGNLVEVPPILRKYFRRWLK